MKSIEGSGDTPVSLDDSMVIFLRKQVNDSKEILKILMDILHAGARKELPYSYVEK